MQPVPPPDADQPGFAIDAFARLEREGRIRWQDDNIAALVGRPTLVRLLRPFLLALHFDAGFYRRQYPDLAQAEADGRVLDLHEHYLEFGYFENRLPNFVEVDAGFYGREYPDVAAGILDRTVRSAQWHFETFGFREGRLPRRGWQFADLARPG